MRGSLGPFIGLGGFLLVLAVLCGLRLPRARGRADRPGLCQTLVGPAPRSSTPRTLQELQHRPDDLGEDRRRHRGLRGGGRRRRVWVSYLLHTDSEGTIAPARSTALRSTPTPARPSTAAGSTPRTSRASRPRRAPGSGVQVPVPAPRRRPTTAGTARSARPCRSSTWARRTSRAHDLQLRAHDRADGHRDHGGAGLRARRAGGRDVPPSGSTPTTGRSGWSRTPAWWSSARRSRTTPALRRRGPVTTTEARRFTEESR